MDPETQLIPSIPSLGSKFLQFQELEEHTEIQPGVLGDDLKLPVGLGVGVED